jgi:NhaA family Na+:H+ antiporter
VVIALFYGQGVDATWLAGAALLVALLLMMNRARVTSGLVYGALGVALWYALHHAGVHATLSGVVVGLMIPARPMRPARDVLQDLSAHLADLDPKARDEELDAEEVLNIEEKLEDLEAPLRRFVHTWHPLVAWFVMPVFALANSGVSVRGFDAAGLSSKVALGVALGLLAGKPLGIFSFTFVAVKLRLARVPGEASLKQLFGVSVVAGIGFTVALFIAMLAYPGAQHLEQAKAGVLVGSLVAGLLGAGFLYATGSRRAAG